LGEFKVEVKKCNGGYSGKISKKIFRKNFPKFLKFKKIPEKFLKIRKSFSKIFLKIFLS